jgi:phosphoribosyl-ATP pyrophosphohydrolase
VRKISSKLIEEASETAVAALSESEKRVVEEASDLIYHLMVLLISRNIEFEEVVNELKRRHR